MPNQQSHSGQGRRTFLKLNRLQVPALSSLCSSAHPCGGRARGGHSSGQESHVESLTGGPSRGKRAAGTCISMGLSTCLSTGSAWMAFSSGSPEHSCLQETAVGQGRGCRGPKASQWESLRRPRPPDPPSLPSDTRGDRTQSLEFTVPQPPSVPQFLWKQSHFSLMFSRLRGCGF